MVLGIIIVKNVSKDENTADEKIGVTTNQVATKKKIDKYEVYNTDIKSEHGRTEITATVKNVTEKRAEQQRVTIVLLDKNKKEIGQLAATIPSLEAGKSTNISAESLTEYKDIYDFEIR